MEGQTDQNPAAAPWALVRRQHGVVARWQLLELGYSPKAIEHRIARGRLHPVARGVYAVGRPQLTRHGEWMAAVLACGDRAVLSHSSAAALWGIRPDRRGPCEVSIPAAARRRPHGITVHRRKALADADVTVRRHIPVTTPVATLIDIANGLSRDDLEAAVNQADLLGLTDPEALREAIAPLRGRHGVPRVRRTIDVRTFSLTRSKLERLFIPIALRAGLPRPLTLQWVNGVEVDFCWPDLGLVVETDGLTYHRTPAQQGSDHVRDHRHTASGLTVMRFTHGQVRYEPDYVEEMLRRVATRLLTAASRASS